MEACSSSEISCLNHAGRVILVLNECILVRNMNRRIPIFEIVYAGLCIHAFVGSLIQLLNS